MLVLMVHSRFSMFLLGLSFVIGVNPQFLATWFSQHSYLLITTSKGESLLGVQMLQSSVTSSGEEHPVTFDIFYWLEARSCPYQGRGRGGYTKK